MSDNETDLTELLKIVDDGTNNNYGEWKIKSYHKLREWDLLKYVEGPTSQPPIIPLRHTTHHGVGDDGNLSTALPGNLAEHEQAIADGEAWMTGNNCALARIVAAVPSRQLHLVEPIKYAKQAWENLRSFYQPPDPFRATAIKRQIMSYRCQSDMDVAKWLNDMQRLHHSLCDTERMSDRDFALAILDLMPQNDGWMGVGSRLRMEVRDSVAQGLPIDSATFIAAIRDEYWYQKYDYQTTSRIIAARFEAQKRSGSQKRPRTGDASARSSTSHKRARVQNADRANLVCANSHCGAPRGHDTAECIAYKGAREGQYGTWWRGPWNIHLAPHLRTKENNIPPKPNPPAVSNSHITDLVGRSTTVQIQSDDDSAQANALPRDNFCHYDSGADRHVFHDRSVFEHYETMQPLAVKGIGKSSSTVAIGRGTVRLEGRYNNHTYFILLEHVLHIPTARSNLISGVQVDKAGVVCTLGNKKIFLSVNDKTIVAGTVINDMYRLDLQVVRPKTASLASRLAAPTFSESSRIGHIISSSHTPSGLCTA